MSSGRFDLSQISNGGASGNGHNDAGPSWASYSAIHNPFRVVINSFPKTAQFGANVVGITEAICGAVNTPSTDTTGNHNAGVSGYSRSASTQKGAVGVFGAGTVDADGVSVWGANFTASNHNGEDVTLGGKDNTTLYGVEIDTGVQKKEDDTHPNVALRGLYIVASGPGRTVNDTNNAVDIDGVGGAYHKRGLYTADGAVSTYGIDLGTTSTGNNTASQSIQFRARSSGGANSVANIQADADGNLVLRAGTDRVVSIQDGGGTPYISAGAARVSLGGTLKLTAAATPASAAAAGDTGDVVWDANYIYICIASSTWRRIAHSTW